MTKVSVLMPVYKTPEKFLPNVEHIGHVKFFGLQLMKIVHRGEISQTSIFEKIPPCHQN